MFDEVRRHHRNRHAVHLGSNGVNVTEATSEISFPENQPPVIRGVEQVVDRLFPIQHELRRTAPVRSLGPEVVASYTIRRECQ